MSAGRLLQISVGVAAGGLFVQKAAPHLFPQELCQRPMQLKINSEPFIVPERCKQQFREVASNMGIKGAEGKVSLFISTGFSPFSAGSTWLPNGAVIGLPRSFLFEREEDVVNSGVVFKNRIINWNSKLGTTLKESLVNSDDNIAFLLGHEVNHIKALDCKYEAILAPTWLCATYKLAISTNKFVPTTPRLLDVALKGGVCLLSCLSYWKLSQFIQRRQEFQADEVSAKCNLRMAKGGVCCMVKRLKLNSVLRVLHGSDGKRMYSKDGEFVKHISHPKLHERLRRLETIVDEKMIGRRLVTGRLGRLLRNEHYVSAKMKLCPAQNEGMAYELAERVFVRFIRISVGVGIGGLAFMKVAPDIFPYSIGKNVVDSGDVCPARCTAQFEEVAQKMGVENTDKICLFMNKGMTGLSSGRTWLPNGAVLGLPIWYGFETAEDVVKSGMNFKKRGIKWESDMGSKIRDSLVPTDDMIAFTIAHELAHIHKTDPKLKAANTAMAPTWVFATYKMASAASKLKLSKMPDIIIKLCVCRLSYLLYKKANQRLQNEIEFHADEIAAQCDPRIARGGIMYFTNRLSLNCVMRFLHGKEGEKYYSEDGDEIESYVHPKLTERLQRLEAILAHQMQRKSN